MTVVVAAVLAGLEITGGRGGIVEEQIFIVLNGTLLNR